jgi:hypothetical protein
MCEEVARKTIVKLKLAYSAVRKIVRKYICKDAKRRAKRRAKSGRGVEPPNFSRRIYIAYRKYIAKMDMPA